MALVNHTLNRNIGMYNMPYMWDGVLFKPKNSKSRTSMIFNKCTGSSSAILNIQDI